MSFFFFSFLAFALAARHTAETARVPVSPK